MAISAGSPVTSFRDSSGAYTLATSIDTAAQASTAPPIAAPGGPNVAAVPPAHPARIVSLEMPWVFPQAQSSGVFRGPRPKEASVSESIASLGGTSTLPTLQTTNLAPPSGPADALSSAASDQPPSPSYMFASPKRRNLTSLPSLSSIPISTPGSTAPAATPTASRPRNAVKNSNSSFVKSQEQCPPATTALKALSPAAGAGGEITFGFATSFKSFIWLVLSPAPPGVSSAPSHPAVISRVTFSACATCVTVNPTTASTDRLDVLIGFSTGDIVHLDPILGKYSRLNKSGGVIPAGITAIRWSPWTVGNFMTSHRDGSIVVWSLDREDAVFTPSPPPPATYRSAMQHLGSPVSEQQAPFDTDLADDMVVTRPPPDRKGRAATTNPVSHWRVSRKRASSVVGLAHLEAVTDFAFSPDLQHCAVTSEDGCLRIIDVPSERLVDAYGSYFGSLLCVVWSPDGRFVLTGGQDDLISVWSPAEQRLVARAQGHASFVTALALDERSTERTLRFASVSEDCQLIFWELNRAALQRPKTAQAYSRRYSINSTLSLTLSRRRTIESSVNHLPLASEGSVDIGPPVWHPPLRKSEVSVLQPVIAKTVSADLLTAFALTTDCIGLIDRGGKVLVFSRPVEQRATPAHAGWR